MKAISFFSVILAMAVLTECVGCNNRQLTKQQASQAERVEHYSGVIPAADAPGIDTDLKLLWAADPGGKNTFELTEEYIGKDKFTTKGTFKTEIGFGDDLDATVFVLTPDSGDMNSADMRYYMRRKGDPKVLNQLTPQRESLENSELNYKLMMVE